MLKYLISLICKTLQNCKLCQVKNLNSLITQRTKIQLALNLHNASGVLVDVLLPCKTPSAVPFSTKREISITLILFIMLRVKNIIKCQKPEKYICVYSLSAAEKFDNCATTVNFCVYGGTLPCDHEG